MTVKETIELIAPEFENVDEDVIDGLIEIWSPMVSKEKFGDTYNLALAYLVCHKMKGMGYGESAFGELSTSGSYGISSISDGGTSISFSNPSTSDSSGDYGTTTYGIQFLQLIKSCIVPITISN